MKNARKALQGPRIEKWHPATTFGRPAKIKRLLNAIKRYFFAGAGAEFAVGAKPAESKPQAPKFKAELKRLKRVYGVRLEKARDYAMNAFRAACGQYFSFEGGAENA